MSIIVRLRNRTRFCDALHDGSLSLSIGASRKTRSQTSLTQTNRNTGHPPPPQKSKTWDRQHRTLLVAPTTTKPKTYTHCKQEWSSICATRRGGHWRMARGSCLTVALAKWLKIDWHTADQRQPHVRWLQKVLKNVVSFHRLARKSAAPSTLARCKQNLLSPQAASCAPTTATRPRPLRVASRPEHLESLTGTLSVTLPPAALPTRAAPHP